MRLRSIPLIVSLALAMFGTAQDTIASPKVAFKVIFNFDFRRTFISGDPNKIYGFRLGAQRQRDIIAIGFYGIGDRNVQEALALPGIGPREVHTDFDYTAISFERLVIDTKRWQVGIPLSIGLGNSRTSYLSDERKLVPYGTHELVTLEATVHADYNVFWCVFVGVGGGYRHVLASDMGTTKTLSDRTDYAKVGVRMGEVVKRVKKSFDKNGEQGSL